ncbi:MAG: YceI family protein [Pyrinomonadaceae bacterium]
MKLYLIAIILVVAFMAACEDPAANKPKAVTSEPSTSQPANQANSQSPGNSTAKGEALEVNPGNSTITFVGSKVTGKHQGGFTMFSGTVDLVNGKPEESSVTVEIDANTIFADDAKLTDHLKSADFFDVAKFPKVSFKSTKIEPGARAPDNHTVTGDLEMHGQTKSITFPAKIDVTDADVTVAAGFRINRKDFGINYSGPADNLIRDDVAIMLNVKAARKQ